MTYENWKVSKADYQESEELQEEYSKVAEWCNNSGKYQIQEVEDAYCVVKIPEPLPPTYEEVKQARANAYEAEVDPLTAQIQRLRDEEATTNELEAEIRALIEERKTRVAEIKARYPYPSEPIEEIEELPVVEESSATVSEMEKVDIVD